MGPKTTPAALPKVKVEKTKIELVGEAGAGGGGEGCGQVGQRRFFGGGCLVSKSCPTLLRLHEW